MTDIMDYFPYDTPRPSQIKLLKWVEANWNFYDLMVFQAPVAFGKSVCAITIGRWSNEVHSTSTGISTPTNILVKQYTSEFKDLVQLKSKSQFASGDLYKQAKDDFKNAPMKIMNNYTLLAARAYSSVQTFDEANELVPMLQDFEGVKFWEHVDGFPPVTTVFDLMLWLAGQKGTKYAKALKLLEKKPEDYTVSIEEAFYRGKIQGCLRIYPLTPRNNKPILWPPSKVKKLLLMSATINKPDVVDLGLNNRRVGIIEVPSDIPPERRPFIYKPQGSMSHTNWPTTIDSVIGFMKQAHNFYKGRGFIHTTYALKDQLLERVPEHVVVGHGYHNKMELLNKWMYSDDRRTFIGCGLTTGLNLKGDSFKWQAITKCPFPDLGDIAVAAKAKNNPEWYAWETIKQIVQAYGRICRSPDDHGVTYMLDSDFERLYTGYNELFPQWFKDAVVGI